MIYIKEEYILNDDIGAYMSPMVIPIRIQECHLEGANMPSIATLDFCLD